LSGIRLLPFVGYPGAWLPFFEYIGELVFPVMPDEGFDLDSVEELMWCWPASSFAFSVWELV